MLRFFLASREDAGDGLGQRQQLFLGHEFVEEFGLVRDGAQPAADIDFKAAFGLTVDLPHLGDAAVVVDADESAGVGVAAGKRCFELAAEVLGVGWPSRK